MVVIDDGSGDGTGTAATLAGAKVIAHAVNQGKGKALNTGFDYAVQRGVDAAITLDADGQHDPDEIPKFVEAFRADKGDIIIGQRDFSQMPAKNQFGNRTGTFLLGLAMGQPVPDNQSGYRLLSRPVMEKVRPDATRFEAEVERCSRPACRVSHRLGADKNHLQRQGQPLPAAARSLALPQDDLAHIGGHGGAEDLIDDVMRDAVKDSIHIFASRITRHCFTFDVFASRSIFGADRSRAFFS